MSLSPKSSADLPEAPPEGAGETATAAGDAGQQAPPEPLSIEALVPRLQPKLRRVLARYRLPVEDAEDVLQQSFLDLVYKQKSIYNPEAWLLATVRNRCIIYWRKRRSQVCESVDLALLDLLAQPEAPRQSGALLRHDLERVLDQLPKRCRALLRLRYGLGYKPAEVAEALGYQPSSVRKVTSRCLSRLTQQLTALGFTDEPDER
jgi:RNA polymerase sigma factor (sigma-70 family)